jgi:hypothetical protein
VGSFSAKKRERKILTLGHLLRRFFASIISLTIAALLSPKTEEAYQEYFLHSSCNSSMGASKIFLEHYRKYRL